VVFLGLDVLIFNSDYWRFCACRPVKPSPGWMLFRGVSIQAICHLLATVLESVALL
jgi:hypothetical protein